MVLDELKSEIEKKNVILGSRKTIKYLKNNKVKLVVIAKNCPDGVKKDLEQYAKLAGIKLEKYEGTATQLGIVCGKPFPVATVSVKK